jgi:hypothetical protein
MYLINLQSFVLFGEHRIFGVLLPCVVLLPVVLLLLLLLFLLLGLVTAAATTAGLTSPGWPLEVSQPSGDPPLLLLLLLLLRLPPIPCTV